MCHVNCWPKVNLPYLDWVCMRKSHVQMKMDCFSWKPQQRLHRIWMSFSMKLVCFKRLHKVWLSFLLKSVYIQSRHYCSLVLNVRTCFLGIHITNVCDCNVVTLVCMWGSKKVSKSTTCAATCWDGTYRQTSKLWPCSEVKLLLFMNLSGSLPMEFQWQELWKYWRHLWHNIKGQATMRSLNVIVIWLFQSEDNLNASVGIM
jgi:hypothetical protein